MQIKCNTMQPIWSGKPHLLYLYLSSLRMGVACQMTDPGLGEVIKSVNIFIKHNNNFLY